MKEVLPDDDDFELINENKHQKNRRRLKRIKDFSEQ